MRGGLPFQVCVTVTGLGVSGCHGTLATVDRIVGVVRITHVRIDRRISRDIRVAVLSPTYADFHVADSRNIIKRFATDTPACGDSREITPFIVTKFRRSVTSERGCE